MKVKLNVEYDLNMDLDCYDYILLSNEAPTYGVEDDVENCLLYLPKEVGDIVRTNVSREERVNKLKGYLNVQYKEKRDELEKIVKNFQDAWDRSGDQVIYCLERFYGKPFPFEEVAAYLTTNVSCPYSFEDKYFYIRGRIAELQLSIANHELNHFMYYYYYPELEKDLGEDKSEALKESLTFFTDINNAGFPDEKDLRKLYLSRKWKNIDEIIEAGKELLLK